MLEQMDPIEGLGSGGVVMAAIRAWRAMGGKWPKSKLGQQAIVLALSIVPAAFFGSFGPVGILGAIGSILNVFGSAVVSDQVTKSLGESVRRPIPYQASPYRSMGSLLIPPPRTPRL